MRVLVQSLMLTLGLYASSLVGSICHAANQLQLSSSEEVEIEVEYLKTLGVGPTLAHLQNDRRPLGYASGSNFLIDRLPRWAEMSIHLDDEHFEENISYFIAVQNEIISLLEKWEKNAEGLTYTLFSSGAEIAQTPSNILAMQYSGLSVVLGESAKLAIQMAYPPQAEFFQNSIEKIADTNPFRRRAGEKIPEIKIILARRAPFTDPFWTLLLFAHGTKISRAKGQINSKIDEAFKLATNRFLRQIINYTFTEHNLVPSLLGVEEIQRRFNLREAVHKVQDMVASVAGENSFAVNGFREAAIKRGIKPITNSWLDICSRYLSAAAHKKVNTTPH